MLTQPTDQTRDITAGRLGWWSPNGHAPQAGEQALADSLQRLGEPLAVLNLDGEVGIGRGGTIALGPCDELADGYPVRAWVPALRPEQLGDEAFRRDHGVRYAYVAGAMANGITSEAMVEAMAKEGMLGYFGSAGLDLDRVEQAIDRLQKNIGDLPYGFNLIHSPSDPQLENAVVELFLRRGVQRVSASAYLDLTLPLVRYRLAGIHRDAEGRIVVPNKVAGKVSRVEVARKFLSPPPSAMIAELLQRQQITTEQAELAALIPMADDITAEADSGGHTDNRPAIALLPTMIALRDRLQEEYGYAVPPRVGAAGGIATPQSVVAAFAMGAAYVLTGSINQSCVEAGIAPSVRQLLAEASQADVVMAPAADMFEMGVKVQVLKWGTMFAVRARKLYDLYRAYNSLDAIPAMQRQILERDYFKAPLAEVWAQTQRFFATRDPQQIERANKDPQHLMALVFRSYLGQSSRWAISGDPQRKQDYQVWCGPAMGAFNEWVADTFLADPQRRDVVTVAMNLMYGAAYLTRVNVLRDQGLRLNPTLQRFEPKALAELAGLVR